jgi:hypothetical protein
MRPFKHCNWPLFSSLLVSDFVDALTEWTPSIVEDYKHHYYRKINEALDGACPKVIFSRSRNLTWWNGELSATIKAVRRAFQLASSHSSISA